MTKKVTIFFILNWGGRCLSNTLSHSGIIIYEGEATSSTAIPEMITKSRSFGGSIGICGGGLNIGFGDFQWPAPEFPAAPSRNDSGKERVIFFDALSNAFLTS